MKKYLFLLGVLSLMPLVAQADMSLDINVPGVSLHLGDQDKSGNYWDGYDWRPPQWWHEHRGGHIGDHNERGYYWDGGRWQPPSAPNGHNPFKGPQSGGPQHNEGRNQGNPAQGNDNNRHGQPGNNNGHGQPVNNNGQGNLGKPGGSNNHASPNNNGGPGGQQVYPQQNTGHR
ncbi:DUF2502 domain-containing protein [Yersinia rohdei]|uniref:DUF2502 domain-containing protein n=1 Tax=Yersinia rohdei TaxID=29485 RepID=UPI0011A13552|nr:DUF2502 domain-containing protein [Yersinia rohdei]